MKLTTLIFLMCTLNLFFTACNSDSSGSPSSNDDKSTTTDQEGEVIELTYNEKAEYLNLYSGCIGCHDNARGLDFNTVNDAISEVNNIFGDKNIDESGGEDAIVDNAIDAIVDLYNSRDDGAPFNYVGENPTGINMSTKVNHNSDQKKKIDQLNAWIIKEHNL